MGRKKGSLNRSTLAKMEFQNKLKAELEQEFKSRMAEFEEHLNKNTPISLNEEVNNDNSNSFNAGLINQDESSNHSINSHSKSRNKSNKNTIQSVEQSESVSGQLMQEETNDDSEPVKEVKLTMDENIEPDEEFENPENNFRPMNDNCDETFHCSHCGRTLEKESALCNRCATRLTEIIHEFLRTTPETEE